MTKERSEYAKAKYIEFGVELANGRYAAAADALNSCIEEAKRDENREDLAFFLQCRANVSFLQGKIEEALNCHTDAEKFNKDSPLIKYHYAKFLTDSIKDYWAAIEKCNELIVMVSSNPWSETEEDFGSEYYLALGYATRGYCFFLLDDIEEAAKNLLLVLKLKDAGIIGHSVDLCEGLLNRKHFVSEAKDYLKHFLIGLKKYNDDEYEEFRERVRKLAQIG